MYEALGRVLENRKGTKQTTIDGYSNFLFLNRDGCPKTNVNYATMFRGLTKKYNKQADTARIKRFEETLKNTEPSNERGIRLGKSQLSKLYLDCAKTSYSMGAELGEVYSYYIQSINYYKDTWTPVRRQTACMV